MTKNFQPFLLDSIRSAQETIRAYDTKAQVTGIMLILSFNVFLGALGRLGGDDGPAALAVIAIAGALLGAIVMVGMVLAPTRNPTRGLDIGGVPIAGSYYVASDLGLGAYLERLQRTEPEQELAFELLKVSRIRDAKHRRYMRALMAAGIAFTVSLLALGLTAVTS